MKQIVYKIQRYILKLCMRYIRYLARKSSLIAHAKSEFNIANPNWETSKKKDFMIEDLLEILSIISLQGDSGGSIGIKRDLLDKLISYKPISNISLLDGDFLLPFNSSSENRHHKRNSHIVKTPKGDIFIIDSIVKKETFYIGEREVVLKGKGSTYTGSVFVVSEQGNIYKINVFAKYNPLKGVTNKTVSIDCYYIEFPKDWWISITTEKEVEKIKQFYDVEEVTNNLDIEIGYKDGIYRNEILKRIDIVRAHIKQNS